MTYNYKNTLSRPDNKNLASMQAVERPPTQYFPILNHVKVGRHSLTRANPASRVDVPSEDLTLDLLSNRTCISWSKSECDFIATVVAGLGFSLAILNNNASCALFRNNLGELANCFTTKLRKSTPDYFVVHL